MPHKNKPVKKGNVMYDEDGGSLVQVTITPSLIKRFITNGNSVEHCPFREYKTYMTGEVANINSIAMDRGNYYEFHTIGENIPGREPTKELPLTKTGKKTAEHVRIDAQVEAFAEVIERYGIVLEKDETSEDEVKYKNVQINQSRPIMIPELDFYVILSPTTDIISPVTFEGVKYKSAIIDLKLTANRDNTYGPFAWGNFEYMDKIQAYINAYVFELPFFYLVFDYRPDDPGHLFIKVNTIEEFHDQDHPFHSEMVNRHVEMKESIRKTAAIIDYYDKAGWVKEPAYNICKDCPLNPKFKGDITCDKVSNSIEF